ncbi:pyridoxamine 5'-phosphate oxidase family protein [Litchfieldia alkalitelluris]|uniref:pyridoxamine 5'-phosphate oxidase family protein n=1 Tax=Litchfieldia alkalitelluris TaxID=304268 RepID=UPI0009987C28|nr:pyridoxamine 5'-phosphate oxidase family protein [Litchfieldia alkalitelluris]
MSEIFKNKVASIDELTALIGGTPSKIASNKVITTLDKHCKNFIKMSPFLLMSTSHRNGTCDVSPRGDQPGFVYIVDEKHIIIPDRPGNKRMDSMRNILTNPYVGLLFLIPGVEETLRINGKAYIIKDQEYLRKMTVNGHIPTLGIGVEIEECFIHCAKAFKRSDLWNPASWPNKEKRPSVHKMIADHVKLPGLTERDVMIALDESYKKRLYN